MRPWSTYNQSYFIGAYVDVDGLVFDQNIGMKSKCDQQLYQEPGL